MDASIARNESSGAGAEAGLRPLLVDARQAARLLSIGRTMLDELIAAGAITPVHIGRCVRFSMVELERFVVGGCVVDNEAKPASNRAAAVMTRQRPARTVRAERPTLRLFDPAG